MKAYHYTLNYFLIQCLSNTVHGLFVHGKLRSGFFFNALILLLAPERNEIG